MIFSSRTTARAAGIACLCALLAGCPGASNPSKPGNPGTAGIPTPPPGAGMPGGSGPPGTGMPGETTPGTGLPGQAPMPGAENRGEDPGEIPGYPDSQDGSSTAASTGGNGVPPYGTGTEAGDGGLDPAEEVAILDAELERGTGDFDDMILDTQQQQRERRRESAPASRPQGDTPGTGTASGGSHGNAETTAPPYEPVADASAAARRDTPPAGNAAVYPAPDDIPSGDDDDLVARQLRELAMSEPDPAVRERLWDEYRKYKGITK